MGMGRPLKLPQMGQAGRHIQIPVYLVVMVQCRPRQGFREALTKQPKILQLDDLPSIIYPMPRHLVWVTVVYL